MNEPMDSQHWATSSDGGAVLLPRHVGFFVRLRARAGLLPGQVSTAALVQARRWRLALWIGVPILAVMIVIPLAIALSSSTHDRQAVVATVLGPGAVQATTAPYEVVLNTGQVLFFDHDLHVRSGQRVLVREKDSDTAIGLVVNGVYHPSRRDTGLGAVGGAIIFGVYAVLLGVFLVPSATWGRRSYKQLRQDMNAPPATARGRYLGSWTWRGMTNRLWRRTSMGHLSGFPIAVEVQTGVINWYGAPLGLVSEVRHFETAISGGSRQVALTYHPNSHALMKLEAVDGSAVLDLARALDEFHPETGLSLKVSRRKRKAHLPDW